jgi:hypothetical protein
LSAKTHKITHKIRANSSELLRTTTDEKLS